jgi:nicotinamidase-related amidase
MELVGIDHAAANAQQLLNKFRAEKRTIVHVRHIAIQPGANFFLPGTKGADIHKQLMPKAGEIVVEKHFPNSFRETELQQILHDLQICSLHICGAMSHMCIDATTRAAFDLGYKCVVAEDACATRDLIFNGKLVSSGQVHAAFMAALSAVYAKVMSTEGIMQQLA